MIRNIASLPCSPGRDSYGVNLVTATKTKIIVG